MDSEAFTLRDGNEPCQDELEHIIQACLKKCETIWSDRAKPANERALAREWHGVVKWQDKAEHIFQACIQLPVGPKPHSRIWKNFGVSL